MLGEFDIIRRHFTRAHADAGLPTGIGDDGAVIRPAAGHELVVVTDTLVASRHFPGDADPADIGWRALAVNLSDIAAMAATARWAFLNLALPDADEAWLDGFAEGFFELAEREGVVLAGGDTTRGPLNITVTIIGEAPVSGAVLRSGAQPGDAVIVTGWPGRARAALECWQDGRPVPDGLRQAWLRPEPLTRAVAAMQSHANAAIDVSDGLAADLGHVLDASGCGATLDADALPVDAALESATGEEAIDYVLHGGDDYELLFTCPPDEADEIIAALDAEGIAACRIGEIDSQAGLRLATSDGECWELPIHGYDHFGE